MLTATHALALLAALMLLALFFIIYLLLNRPKQATDTGVLQMMLTLLTDLKQDLSSANVQSRTEMQDRLDAMLRQLVAYQQNTASHLLHQHQTSASLINDISSKLNTLENTNRQILGFAEQMKSLEKILLNPKQRGILGEFFLESLLQNLLPPGQFKMQYVFANNEKVDAALFFKDKIVPIDAKFSLDNYNRLLAADNPADQQQADRLFRTDLKKRIDETAKYIKPDENTTDFALMFLPAEGIYYHLLNPPQYAAALPNVLEYAFAKKVIIVSPVSFYAYLQTIMQGLKALKIEASVKEVVHQVTELGKQLRQYETYMDKLGKTLQTATDMHLLAQKELLKINKTITALKNPVSPKTPDEQGNLFN